MPAELLHGKINWHKEGEGKCKKELVLRLCYQIEEGALDMLLETSSLSEEVMWHACWNQE
jgi:hypothetical protein